MLRISSVPPLQRPNQQPVAQPSNATPPSALPETDRQSAMRAHGPAIAEAEAIASPQERPNDEDDEDAMECDDDEPEARSLSSDR
jgi:hypothetical protein